MPNAGVLRAEVCNCGRGCGVWAQRRKRATDGRAAARLHWDVSKRRAQNCEAKGFSERTAVIIIIGPAAAARRKLEIRWLGGWRRRGDWKLGERADDIQRGGKIPQPETGKDKVRSWYLPNE